MNLRIQELFSYFRNQWVTVLVAVAVVSTVAYIVLITDIRDQEGDSIQLKLSARQSFYVENIGLSVQELIDAHGKKTERNIRGRLLDGITRLEDMHLSLASGDKFIQQGTRFTRKRGHLPPELADLYYGKPDQLDRQVKAYIKAAKGVLSLHGQQIELQSPPVAYLLSDARHRLLGTLEKAVGLYQAETNYRFRATQDLQTFMYALTLASLLLVGSVILKPLIVKLNESMKNLREEKDFTENILNTSQALIIALDANGKIALFNAFAEEITGWQEEELIGQDFFSRFLLEEDRTRMQQTFQELFTAKNVDQKNLETLLTIRSNEQLNIFWHTSVVLDPLTLRASLFLATGIDITERKRADERLQTAMMEVGELNARLQDEIRLAAALQKVLLPDTQFNLAGLSGRTLMKTSSEVGGDYYDYYPAGESGALLFIGDVSGHGVAAGTMVSAAKAGVSPLVHQGILQPSKILRSLNETIRLTAQESLLMTMLCLYFDATSGELIVSNAGHVLPFHYSTTSKQWTMLESLGFPLGQDPDFDYASSELQTHLEIGDRLFLYTDGLVEEESLLGEPFGYDRLEQLLNDHLEADDETLMQTVLDAIHEHSERQDLEDDITILMVRHTDRVQPIASTRLEAGEIVKISESAYRTQMHSLPRISRQYVVFMAEDDFSDLLKRFTEDGIRRVLPVHPLFYQRLGWDHLLMQHLEPADDDIYQLMPAVDVQRQIQMTDTDDKSFMIEEIQAWLTEQSGLPPEHIDSLIIVLDEMIENALYAAPRDGQNRQLYKKGTLRHLDDNENVFIDIAIGDGVLGLMVTDHWGTFTPAIFLKYMTQTLNQGIEPGIGGGGMYLMWFLSDYLQVRVRPHLKTQVTALWDLNHPPVEASLNSGFQFLHHSEYDEAISYHDQ